MKEILVFTMFCVAHIAADETQVRYSIHRTTGSESVTSTCLKQCAAGFSKIQSAGVRVSGSECLCEELGIEWASALPMHLSPGYVYMIKQESKQTFTQLNIGPTYMPNLPMMMSGTLLNVDFAPTTTLKIVEIAFTDGYDDFPFYIWMDFDAQTAKKDTYVNGRWGYLSGEQQIQAFTGSVTSQHTLTFEVDQTGLTKNYLDGVTLGITEALARM